MTGHSDSDTTANGRDGRTDSDADAGTGRRTFVKGLGAGAAATALGASAGAASAGATPAIHDSVDLTGGRTEVVVVFTSNAAAGRLSELSAPTHVFETLPMGLAALDPAGVREVAGWETVVRVYGNEPLEYHNDDARVLTKAREVQAGTGVDTGYTGENVQVAVIDSGIDGDHPDHAGELRHNFKGLGIPVVQDEPLRFVDFGNADTDDYGHGTHCAGSIRGEGVQSDGQYRGMAPGADLTMYSTGYGLLIAFIVAAFDHIITRKRRGKNDIQVVSNSYGPINDGRDVDPYEPVNVAAWYAANEGILSLFSAGNSGPGTSSLSQYAKLPYTLGVAATHDVSEGRSAPDRTVTDFSSRGRPNAAFGAGGADGPNNYDRGEALENIRQLYDPSAPAPDGPFGVYRNHVAAPGNLVMSTLAPADALQVYPALVGGRQDAEVYYGKVSGTSMSCPVTAGCATLVVDAFEQAGRSVDGLDDVLAVINTLEATAKNYHPLGSDTSGEQGSAYTAVNAGTGFVDVRAAVARAEAGDAATLDEAHENIIPNGSVYGGGS